MFHLSLLIFKPDNLSFYISLSKVIVFGCLIVFASLLSPLWFDGVFPEMLCPKLSKKYENLSKPCLYFCLENCLRFFFSELFSIFSCNKDKQLVASNVAVEEYGVRFSLL